MDIQHGNEQQRYWSEVIDEKAGTRKVTVAAEITFTLDEKSGMQVGEGRLLIAGGNVATSGLITIDDALAVAIDAHDMMTDDDNVDVTVLSAAAESRVLPEIAAIVPVPEEVPPQRSRVEEQAARLPERFV